MSTKNLSDTLDNLIKIMEEADKKPNLIQGPALNVVDLSKEASEYLTPKAITALHDPVVNKLDYKVCGVEYKALYLNCVVKRENVMKGLKLVCEDLNALAARDLIASSLSKPGWLELSRMPLSFDTAAVFSFVHVPASRFEEARSLIKHEQRDSSILPDPVEDTSIDLPEGEFIAVERLTLSVGMLQTPFRSKDAMIHDRIGQYLAVLPKGTELVSVTECIIADLSLPFEIKFRNPVMKDYKEVKAEWVRSVVVIDDSLKQFNLFLGMTYVKRNGETVGLMNSFDGSKVFPAPKDEAKDEENDQSLPQDMIDAIGDFAGELKRRLAKHGIDVGKKGGFNEEELKIMRQETNAIFKEES